VAKPIPEFMWAVITPQQEIIWAAEDKEFATQIAVVGYTKKENVDKKDAWNQMIKQGFKRFKYQLVKED
jgi:hypothetical protein